MPPALIAEHGAVSAEVAAAMAAGALAVAPVDLAVSVTGIAGPGGGTRRSRWGWSSSASAGAARRPTERHVFPGDRAAVRRAATERALELLLAAAGG